MEELKPSHLTKLTKTGLFAACALTFSWGSAHAGYVGDSLGVSPFRDWRTIESKHFLVNYPSEQEKFAQVATDYLEEAWGVLTERLYWTPFWRINVMVLDNSDAANGSSTPFARFGISLYPIPPDVQFATSFTDDWIRLLVWHELTHFINLDVTRSFYSPFRFILGDVMLPNTLWPAWMIEGLAVYVETRYTHAGRGRSPYWEGVLRAAVAERQLGERSWLTLDRVNGSYPWFPGGETRYLFGYQLMNQVAQDSHLKQKDGKETQTADGENSIRDGDDALGLLSWRSGGRIPFFINGNLENLTSKSWYDYWGEFIVDTRERMEKQLDKIRSQSLTQYERLTEEGFSSWGATVSPDGQWLAYSKRNAEERPGLRIIELKTGATQRLDDKLYGVSMAFIPGSNVLVYSQLEQSQIYNSWSDLHYREIPSGKSGRLTSRLRAKDPDVSSDGHLVAFTIADQGGNSLAVAPLELGPAGPRLGAHEILFRPAPLDRVGTPKFSKDSKRIVFSVLKRGKQGEELLELDLSTRKTKVLIDDGARNVFPAFHPNGQLYHVSSKSGVENLFHLRDNGTSEQVSNIATGLWYPSFAPDGTLFGSILSTDGWDIARIALLKSPVPSKSVQVSAETAPPIDSLSANQAQHETRESSAYNPLRSLAPRIWSPALEVSYGTVNGFQSYLGAAAIGFDTLDFHLYQVDLGYRTFSRTLEGSAHYEYRGLGPAFGLDYSDRVLATNGIDTIRNRAASVTASLPIRFTWSSLTPSLSISGQQDFLSSPGLPDEVSTYIPRLTALLSYRASNTPDLAIYSIAGRSIVLGSRIYSEEGNLSVKGLATWEENLRLGAFWVLSPSLGGSITSQFAPSGFQGKNVFLLGRGNGLSGVSGASLTQVTVRGHQGLFSATPWALVPAIDLRFPLLRIFEGLGTQPVFAENLWAQAFVENGISQSAWGETLQLFPAAGIGLRLNTLLFLNSPIRWGLDLHHGFDRARGGSTDLFFSLQGSLL